MRIALVSREYPPFFGGGIGAYVRNIAPALAEAGCDVHVITQAHDESHPRVEATARVTTHRVGFTGQPVGRAPNTLRFGAAAGATAASLFARGRIDVVEFAECEGAGCALAAMRAAIGPRRGALPPSVVHFHTPTEQLLALRTLHQDHVDPMLAAYILVERGAILTADLLCAPSRFIATWARDHYGLPATPDVVPYALAPLPPPAPWPVERRVLCVGRLEPRKGVEPLARAWALVAPRRPGWRLRFVGADTPTGPGRRSMREHMRSALPREARDTTEFVDALPPALLAAEYAGAALCVVPSLWENFPNTCMEAMAQARPVLVSDEGGMREMLADGGGEVFRSGDAEDLATRLLAFTGEPAASLEERGRRARAGILRLCDPATIAARRVDLYRRAATAARTRTGVDHAGRRLRAWRHARDAAAGRVDGLDLPAAPTGAAVWLARSGA